jgi:hypothetical protein
MNPVLRSVAAGGVQIALLLTIAGKYAVDRMTLPQVWVRVTPFDPSLPIRGRYVRLQVHAGLRETGGSKRVLYGSVALSIEDGQLIATATDTETGVMASRSGDDSATLNEAMVFFIPEHVADPSRRPPGEELWAEVSVPKRGPPRPLRLGVKRAGKITPLELD